MSVEVEKLPWKVRDPTWKGGIDGVLGAKERRSAAARRGVETRRRNRLKAGGSIGKPLGERVDESLPAEMARLGQIGLFYHEYMRRGDSRAFDEFFERVTECFDQEEVKELLSGVEVMIQMVVRFRRGWRKADEDPMMVISRIYENPGLRIPRRGNVAILLITIDPDDLAAMDMTSGAASASGMPQISSGVFARIASGELNHQVHLARKRKDKIRVLS